ncbi:retrovirus-related Pol polyprotein from transposon 17.6 [Trichonephila clavipes]|nr:retrovirus-related Pol polyprotein from transposon 17.6 [Trichonephila clavipes]
MMSRSCGSNKTAQNVTQHVDLLKDTFGDRLISRFGPVNWPPRSCDLTPLDYFLWGYVKSLVSTYKPQMLGHLEDNIRRVIVDIRPQMLEKVIENWTSRLDYIRASRGSPIPEIIFKKESEELASDYDHVKALLLKRFKLSLEKFRQLFVKHQKNPETTWDDFYYELQTYFEGWIAGLGITTFEQLKDLMITDQLKKKAPIEFKEYHLDEWSGIISPVDLARKIEEYEDVRKTFQKKVTW